MAENELAGEASTYLQQHARNPVRWHAWNGPALARARDEGKPIFLSVGYSSCHWCHVMAHESFEDEGIAGVMNEHFVSIKVDREERPDIDHVYQRACQVATGQGGWPLSAFLTPEQKPFYVGTYFPPLDSHGRPGFGSILRRLAQEWRERPGDVRRAADRFAESMAEGAPAARAAPAGPRRDALDEAAVGLLRAGDATFGGFGGAPKFPNAACVSFLLRHSRLSGVRRFRDFALLTLSRMARGGIFDHVGGGFHRYSTDAKWHVPHFEKMLYDNALIPVNYAEAYQATGDASYLRTMRMTLDYVLRELSSPEGGFYSSQDADTGGGEGAYYVWSRAEVEGALGPDAEAFCLYYDVAEGGNWEGANVLHNSVPASAVAFRCGAAEGAVRGALERGAARLLELRSAREPPGLDSKAIASWNALAATALARGAGASGDGRYLEAARRCLSFIGSRLDGAGGLRRVWAGGRAAIPGQLDDHANYANALLDVFEADPEERLLSRAADVAGRMVGGFWDRDGGSFYMTAAGDGGLIVRPRSAHDLSLPSGASSAVRALLRLHALTGDGGHLEVAERAIAAHARGAAENPFAFGGLLCSMHALEQGPAEVTVLRPGAIAAALRRAYVPEAAVVTVRTPGQLAALSGYPYFAGKEFPREETVHVCRGRSCSAPVTTLGEAEALLGAGGAAGP